MSDFILYVQFNGWFQLRLATNPDPISDLWGGSGYTYALPSEEPLDGIIRFQNPHCPRTEGPEVGVVVVSAELRELDDSVVRNRWPWDSIVGARVELGPEARFIGENDLVDPQIVLPWPYRFELGIDGGVVLSRGLALEARGPDWLRLLSRDERLAFKDTLVMKPSSRTNAFEQRRYWKREKELGAQLDGRDAREHLRARAQRLLNRLQESSDGNFRIELATRIFSLLQYETGLPPGEHDRVHDQFFQRLTWNVSLDGSTRSSGWWKEHGIELEPTPSWESQLTMKLWDGDALCGHVRGDLKVRVRPIE